MTLKNKINLSFIFLFVLIICLSFGGAYFVRSLGESSKNILKDNYRTLNYMNEIRINANLIQQNYLLGRGSEALYNKIDVLIDQQFENITEENELQLTDELKDSFVYFKSVISEKNPDNEELFKAYNGLSDKIDVIYKLNEKAILTRSNLTVQLSDSANWYVGILGFLSVVFGIILITIIPSSATSPLISIEEPIKRILQGDFKVHFPSSSDVEFQYISDGFNKLLTYINSVEFQTDLKDKRLIQQKLNFFDLLEIPVMFLDESKVIVYANASMFQALETNLSIEGKFIDECGNQNAKIEKLASFILVNNESKRAYNFSLGSYEKITSINLNLEKNSNLDRLGTAILLH